MSWAAAESDSIVADEAADFLATALSPAEVTNTTKKKQHNTTEVKLNERIVLAVACLPSLTFYAVCSFVF